MNLPNKKELLTVSTLEELYLLVKDEEARGLLDFLNKEKPALIEKLFLLKNFHSKEEILVLLKGGACEYLALEYTSLKSRLSSLRKKGEDVTYLDLKSKSIPLKIKIFEASFGKKDFDYVINLMHIVDNGLRNLEKRNAS